MSNPDGYSASGKNMDMDYLERPSRTRNKEVLAEQNPIDFNEILSGFGLRPFDYDLPNKEKSRTFKNSKSSSLEDLISEVGSRKKPGINSRESIYENSDSLTTSSLRKTSTNQLGVLNTADQSESFLPRFGQLNSSAKNKHERKLFESPAKSQSKSSFDLSTSQPIIDDFTCKSTQLLPITDDLTNTSLSLCSITSALTTESQPIGDVFTNLFTFTVSQPMPVWNPSFGEPVTTPTAIGQPMEIEKSVSRPITISTSSYGKMNVSTYVVSPSLPPAISSMPQSFYPDGESSLLLDGGVTESSIASAMYTLEKAISMLNSVAMDTISPGEPMTMLSTIATDTASLAKSFQHESTGNGSLTRNDLEKVTSSKETGSKVKMRSTRNRKLSRAISVDDIGTRTVRSMCDGKIGTIRDDAILGVTLNLLDQTLAEIQQEFPEPEVRSKAATLGSRGRRAPDFKKTSYFDMPFLNSVERKTTSHMSLSSDTGSLLKQLDPSDDLDESLRKILDRQDSFNRPGSALYDQQLPLPKDSVIQRYRRKKKKSSASSSTSSSSTSSSSAEEATTSNGKSSSSKKSNRSGHRLPRRQRQANRTAEEGNTPVVNATKNRVHHKRRKEKENRTSDPEDSKHPNRHKDIRRLSKEIEGLSKDIKDLHEASYSNKDFTDASWVKDPPSLDWKPTYKLSSATPSVAASKDLASEDLASRSVNPSVTADMIGIVQANSNSDSERKGKSSASVKMIFRKTSQEELDDQQRHSGSFSPANTSTRAKNLTPFSIRHAREIRHGRENESDALKGEGGEETKWLDHSSTSSAASGDEVFLVRVLKSFPRRKVSVPESTSCVNDGPTSGLNDDPKESISSGAHGFDYKADGVSRRIRLRRSSPQKIESDGEVNIGGTSFTGNARLTLRPNINERGPNIERGLNNERGPNIERGPNNERGTNNERGPNNEREPNSERGSNIERGPNNERRTNNERGPNIERGPNFERGPNPNERGIAVPFTDASDSTRSSSTSSSSRGDRHQKVIKAQSKAISYESICLKVKEETTQNPNTIHVISFHNAPHLTTFKSSQDLLNIEPARRRRAAYSSSKPIDTQSLAVTSSPSVTSPPSSHLKNETSRVNVDESRIIYTTRVPVLEEEYNKPGLNQSVKIEKLEPVSLTHKLEPVSLSHKLEPVSLSHKLEPVLLSHKLEPVSLSHKLEPVSLSHKLEPVSLSHKLEPVLHLHKLEPVSLSQKPEPVSVSHKLEPVSVSPHDPDKPSTMLVEVDVSQGSATVKQGKPHQLTDIRFGPNSSNNWKTDNLVKLATPIGNSSHESKQEEQNSVQDLNVNTSSGNHREPKRRPLLRREQRLEENGQFMMGLVFTDRLKDRQNSVPTSKAEFILRENTARVPTSRANTLCSSEPPTTRSIIVMHQKADENPATRQLVTMETKSDISEETLKELRSCQSSVEETLKELRSCQSSVVTQANNGKASSQFLCSLSKFSQVTSASPYAPLSRPVVLSASSVSRVNWAKQRFGEGPGSKATVKGRILSKAASCEQQETTINESGGILSELKSNSIAGFMIEGHGRMPVSVATTNVTLTLERPTPSVLPFQVLTSSAEMVQPRNVIIRVPEILQSDFSTKTAAPSEKSGRDSSREVATGSDAARVSEEKTAQPSDNKPTVTETIASIQELEPVIIVESFIPEDDPIVFLPVLNSVIEAPQPASKDHEHVAKDVIRPRIEIPDIQSESFVGKSIDNIRLCVPELMVSPPVDEQKLDAKTLEKTDQSEKKVNDPDQKLGENEKKEKELGSSSTDTLQDIPMGLEPRKRTFRSEALLSDALKNSQTITGSAGINVSLEKKSSERFEPTVSEQSPRSDSNSEENSGISPLSEVKLATETTTKDIEIEQKKLPEPQLGKSTLPLQHKVSMDNPVSKDNLASKDNPVSYKDVASHGIGSTSDKGSQNVVKSVDALKLVKTQLENATYSKSVLLRKAPLPVVEETQSEISDPLKLRDQKRTKAPSPPNSKQSPENVTEPEAFNIGMVSKTEIQERGTLKSDRKLSSPCSPDIVVVRPKDLQLGTEPSNRTHTDLSSESSPESSGLSSAEKSPQASSSTSKSLTKPHIVRKQLIHLDSALHPSSAAVPSESKPVEARWSPKLVRKLNLAEAQDVNVSDLNVDPELMDFLKKEMDKAKLENTSNIEQDKQSKPTDDCNTQTKPSANLSPSKSKGNNISSPVPVAQQGTTKQVAEDGKRKFFSTLKATTSSLRSKQASQLEDRSQDKNQVDRLASFAIISDVGIGAKRRQFQQQKNTEIRRNSSTAANASSTCSNDQVSRSKSKAATENPLTPVATGKEEEQEQKKRLTDEEMKSILDSVEIDSDDDFDRMVEINFKEIASNRNTTGESESKGDESRVKGEESKVKEKESGVKGKESEVAERKESVNVSGVSDTVAGETSKKAGRTEKAYAAATAASSAKTSARNSSKERTGTGGTKTGNRQEYQQTSRIRCSGEEDPKDKSPAPKNDMKSLSKDLGGNIGPSLLKNQDPRRQVLRSKTQPLASIGIDKTRKMTSHTKESKN